MKSFFELLERRSAQYPTIFCSQYSFHGWIEGIGGGAIAGAILGIVILRAFKMGI